MKKFNSNQTWQDLELYVRDMAAVIWRKTATPSRIAGVNFDNVLHLSEEEIIIIEVTENHTLEKIRTDVAKFVAIKLKYAAQSIIVRAFIVTKKEPSQGMVDIGKENNVKVLSALNFSKDAFNYSSYVSLRENSVFGSAIDPATGKTDSQEYIPVYYKGNGINKLFSIEKVSERLASGEKLVLLGNYGTGKSRCVHEIFKEMSSKVEKYSGFPLAINLREHWGAGTAIEVISGHFSRLGMSGSIDKAMQLLNNGHLILLLDGFDEVGAQTFGISQHKRAAVRKHALQGIRELIAMSHGGVLITGRPHYFNDDKELIDSLGVKPGSTPSFILNCDDEFNDEQAQAYLNKIDLLAKVPPWLPKKPLMFQILAAIDKEEAKKILSTEMGEVGFWGQFLDLVCVREARIHSSLDAESVRRVLINLAKITRESDRALGRLTPKDFNQAYLNATGYDPDASGEVMLSRLCTLGRIEPESPDRQFVDPYIVQLLFADSLIDDITNKNFEILKLQWRQALQSVGLFFLAQWIESYALSSEAMSIIQRESKAQNFQAVGEIVAALTLLDGPDLDFQGVLVPDAEISILDFSTRLISNITFKECIFGTVSFDSCKISESSNVRITDSTIQMATGITSTEKIPSWLTNCSVSNTETVSNSARIKASNLPAGQKLFLSIIHKIFFQSGGGRKENTLYKGGYGQQFDRKLIEDILKTLVSEGYVEKSKDGAGFIYNPKREFTAKMKAIKDQLTLSKDQLWLSMERLS